MQHDPHVKDEARRLVESLPDDATWDDLLHLIYTQQRVDEGIADLEGGGRGPATRLVKSSTSRDEGRFVGPCAQAAGRHPHTNRVGGSREQANKVVDGILRRGDQLETFPASGCKVEHYNRPDIRELIEGP